MKLKYTNHARATIWTPTMKIESSGSPDGVCVTVFRALDTFERRAKVLKELTELHADKTAWEEERDARASTTPT